jgi:hypothetical protein
MRKILLILIAAAAFLGATSCKSPTSPSPDEAPVANAWTATKAEFVSVANPSIKVDIIAQEGALLSIDLKNPPICLLSIWHPMHQLILAWGRYTATEDVLTIHWTSWFSGVTQFHFIVDNDGWRLTLTGGHLPFEFTPGNPEEAVLNAILQVAAEPLYSGGRTARPSVASVLGLVSQRATMCTATKASIILIVN